MYGFNFGLDNGVPWVASRRGRYEFPTIDDAAAFAAERVAAYLEAEQETVSSEVVHAEACNGRLVRNEELAL
jgi:hypothetical protein